MQKSIADCLKLPTECDNCQSLDIIFCSNDKLYGEVKGNWPYIYYCKICHASVGCHAGTKFPLGKLATRKIKALRRDAHEVFDKLWRLYGMNRDDAYLWLALVLKIDIENCHIATLSEEQLHLAIQQSAAKLIHVKREAKKNAKQHKRIEKQNESFRRNRHKYGGRR